MDTLRKLLGSCLLLMLLSGSAICAEPEQSGAEPPQAKEKISTDEPKTPQVTMKTLGGRQFWGDVCLFRGWRIQRHVMTGHCRLLDPRDVRHAHGQFEHCREVLARIRQERKLEPMSGKAVVLIHGIFRSSKTFGRMRKQLEDDGYLVLGFDYPSTRVSISDSADYLGQAIESLEGIEEINFVVHSMGGLVVRAYLDGHHDPRIRRMVMMGVPNRGATMADRLRANMVYRLLWGPAGQQLTTDPEGFIAKLPIPEFEFGIVAGGRSTLKGFNPLIGGDDDGTVSVLSTRLPGAADFLVVNCLHSFLPNNPEIIEATVRFLDEGHFRVDGLARPIVDETEADASEAADSVSPVEPAPPAGN